MIPYDKKNSSERDITKTLWDEFSNGKFTDIHHNTEVPKEFKKVLKEVIECFNQFSNPIIRRKTANSSEYKHSLRKEIEYSFLLKNLFVNTKDCEIYLGSFSDRFNYSFLEDNKFSTSLFYNQIIDQVENNTPLIINKNSHLKSSLLYLS